MLDRRSFSLLHAMTRFGSRNETVEDFAREDRDDPQPREPEFDISDMRERQETLLNGIAQTLRKAEIKPYRKLMGRLAASSRRPAA